MLYKIFDIGSEENDILVRFRRKGILLRVEDPANAEIEPEKKCDERAEESYVENDVDFFVV